MDISIKNRLRFKWQTKSLVSDIGDGVQQIRKWLFIEKN